MLKKASMTLFAAAAVAALAGCASKPAADPAASARETARNVDQRLSEAASRAMEAQERLARIQSARTAPSPSQLDETALPEELKRPATVDWSGPADDVAEKIARLVGYDFKVTGNRPSIPVVVHISITDVPVAKALEDIGLQAYPFGEVAVDPNAKRIEFRYLQAQQQPIRAEGASPSWGK